jgi:hypothetical protein
MRTAVLLAGAVAIGLLAGCGGSEEEERKPFKVGVASVKITPDKQGLYLGGWGNNRAFTTVHDDIYARAIVFERGETKVAWVTLDLVGLMGPDVEDVRSRVKDLPPENIVICSTHVHSAPDTIGLWGPDETTPGVDQEYVEFVKQRTADAIKQALRASRVARVRFARTGAPPKCAKNFRDAESIDTEISILQIVNPADEPVATVVNWGCHPECLDKHNLELTSDWVHWLRQVVEGKTQAPCLFFNGALGGMVSPDIEAHTFAEAERVGTAVGEAVVKALAEAEGPLRPDLEFRTQKVSVPLQTQRLRQALQAGIIVPYKGHKADEVETEVAVMWLGPSVWMTMPGEPLPAVGLEAKNLADADYKFFVSLANNELGYILPKQLWGQSTYDYEMSMSMGPDTADILLNVLKSLLSNPPEWTKRKAEKEERKVHAATEEKSEAAEAAEEKGVSNATVGAESGTASGANGEEHADITTGKSPSGVAGPMTKSAEATTPPPPPAETKDQAK